MEAKPVSNTTLKKAKIASLVTLGESEDKKYKSYSEIRIPFFHEILISCSKGKAERQWIYLNILLSLWTQSGKGTGGIILCINATAEVVCLQL